MDYTKYLRNTDITNQYAPKSIKDLDFKIEQKFDGRYHTLNMDIIPLDMLSLRNIRIMQLRDIEIPAKIDISSPKGLFSQICKYNPQKIHDAINDVFSNDTWDIIAFSSLHFKNCDAKLKTNIEGAELLNLGEKNNLFIPDALLVHTYMKLIIKSDCETIILDIDYHVIHKDYFSAFIAIPMIIYINNYEYYCTLGHVYKRFSKRIDTTHLSMIKKNSSEIADEFMCNFLIHRKNLLYKLHTHTEIIWESYKIIEGYCEIWICGNDVFDLDIPYQTDKFPKDTLRYLTSPLQRRIYAHTDDLENICTWIRDNSNSKIVKSNKMTEKVITSDAIKITQTKMDELIKCYKHIAGNDTNEYFIEFNY